MNSYKYKNVCSSDTSVLAEAIKSSYPIFSDDGITYLSEGVQFIFSGDSVSYAHMKKTFNGNNSPVLSNITIRLPTCENVGVFDRVMPMDFGVIVFLVLSFLLGLAVGARGHG